MSTPYSHRLRILACASCGAPVDAQIAGGSFRCAYCAAVNRLERREEERDRERARAAANASISESERIARLRDQHAGTEALPASIEALVGPDGQIVDVEAARSEWIRTRRQLLQAPAFAPAERLFHLTVLLEPHLEELARRAVLETAVEMLEDERHRHVLRCMLAAAAARAGELDAAEEWLAAVNPRPLDLAMDSALRVAAATVATARAEHERVLGLLGRHAGDLPVFERDALVCTLLRAHSLENTGEETEAGRILDEAIEVHGAARVDAALARQLPLRLCPRARMRAKRAELRRRVSQLEETVRARSSSPWRWLLWSSPWLVATPLVCGACSMLVGLEVTEGLDPRSAEAVFWGVTVGLFAIGALFGGIVLHGLFQERRRKQASLEARLEQARHELREIEARIQAGKRGTG